MDREEREQADRGVGVRTAGCVASDRHAAAATEQRRSESRKSIQSRGAVGRESRGAEGDRRSFRIAAVFRVARAGIYFAIGAADSRGIRRMGRGAEIFGSGRARDRSESGAMRRSAEGRIETGAV